jgi:hypothetical protein
MTDLTSSPGIELALQDIDHVVELFKESQFDR